MDVRNVWVRAARVTMLDGLGKDAVLSVKLTLLCFLNGVNVAGSEVNGQRRGKMLVIQDGILVKEVRLVTGTAENVMS
jgi:hypothetical protein